MQGTVKRGGFGWDRNEFGSHGYLPWLERPALQLVVADRSVVASNLVVQRVRATEVMQLHPDFAPDPVRSALIWDSEGYAPLVVAPAQLAPIKDRLRRQAEALEVARKGWRRGSKAA
jgi:hypothetical protein